ncbi:MAG: poly-gamma-glutamate system protein [Candidatus Neomarinimicrobiota bacterium]|nr:poly-gamma-glutamate system protein [Candidatus Neomarinimicrobiota bacterium]
MNNYKKQPFIPAIQKTSTLVVLSVIAVLSLIVSINSITIDISPSYDLKIKAARLMQESMLALKNNRMESGVFIDDENDPNETGLVGSPFSLLTTDEGNLDAKLTTLDPNFSAGMVDLMFEMRLQRGDTIAILLTGSMPGANIAVLTAAKAIGLVPIMITSVGASQWGANHVDFTWLDMEAILYNNGFITNRSIAASIGGRNDIGRLLSPDGRGIIVNNILNHGIPIIKKTKLAENIEERMQLFERYINIEDYSAMINIGGGVASLGTSFNSKLLAAGIVSRSDVTEISLREGGIEGGISKFAQKNVPILHVLNIKSLTEQLGMPFAPIPIPEIGSGSLYAEERYNIFVSAVCLIVVCSLVFAVGYHSKQKIKEHLVDHEPDSLL